MNKISQVALWIVKKDGYQGELFIENPEGLDNISQDYKRYKTISFYAINKDISYIIDTEDIDDIKPRLRAIDSLPLPLEDYPMYRIALL